MKIIIISDSKGKANELVFRTETPPYDIPKQMLLPLLAAYRANVYYDAAGRKIGWFEDNKKLFKSYNKELCTKMKTAFKVSKNDLNRIGKDPIIWENLFTTLQSHISKNNIYKTYDI